MEDKIQKLLFKYCLRLGDNSLILGQRLSEWCGHGPQLEEDIALTNIALDLIGQARNLLSLAGEIEGKGQTEDDLAFKRNANEFLNIKLMEIPNGDFGKTIARQFFVDQFNVLLFEALKHSKNEGLQAIALKSIKEVTYHARHSAEWMIRLGDGTEVSKEKITEGIAEVWQYTGELFETDEVENVLIEAGIAADTKAFHAKWLQNIEQILAAATLKMPEQGWNHSGGRKGEHTEHLGYMLAEMQYLPRTYPDAKW